MPFKLVIKNNLEEAETAFSRGDIRHFEEDEVTVGASPDCRCHVQDDNDELAERHFQFFKEDSERDEFSVRLLEGDSLYVNLEPVADTRQIASGDELRTGHYSFRFQKEYRRTRPGRRADIFAVTAKAIIVLLLIGEVSFVYWLPQQIQSEEILAAGIIKQETVSLLDESRKKARPPESGDTDNLKRYARQLIYRELNAMARFIRKHEQAIPDGEWQRLHSAIRKLNSTTTAINNNNVFQPLPQPQVEKGVDALLERYNEGNNQDGG